MATKITDFIKAERDSAVKTAREVLQASVGAITKLMRDEQADHEDIAAAMRALYRLEDLVESCE